MTTEKEQLEAEIAKRDARIAELELAVSDYREQLPAGLLRRIASVNPDSTRPETCGVVVPRPLLENCASYMEGSASPTVASWHKSICALLLTPRAQQPSAGVVLPERANVCYGSALDTQLAEAYNEALDEVERLNRK